MRGCSRPRRWRCTSIRFTNNSSLVLAIELVASGKVLLFAADAQTGNWSSWAGVNWDDHTVHTDDLLARTVFYKVGHHASHNATLVAAFEKMDRRTWSRSFPFTSKTPTSPRKTAGRCRRRTCSSG